MSHFSYAVHVRIGAPHHSEGLVLQACHGSPDGSIHISYPDVCACLFIRVKVRVPQREVASCCFLPCFHWDVQDCCPVDRLAVTLTFSFQLFENLQKFSSVFHKKLVPLLFLPFFEAFSNKVYYAIQINLVDFVKSLLRVLAEIPLTDRPKQNKQSRCQPSPQREETAVMMKPSMVTLHKIVTLLCFKLSA